MYRIGSSRDIHKLIAKHKLYLGGVLITDEIGPLAHSDGDVLIHAVAEAIIGALALGDLGDHFSDQDPKFKGITSTYFLMEVLKMLQQHQYEIINIDTTIILERIRLEPFKKTIKTSMAKLLKIEETNFNVKAQTNEGLDALGRGEALGAEAVVLLRKKGETR